MEGQAPLAMDLVTGPALSMMLPFGGGGGGADAPRRRLASSLLFSLLFSFFRLRASDAPFFGGGASLGAAPGEGRLSVFLSFVGEGGKFFSPPYI